jgi:pilus assembly protein Flp/PilA
MIKFILKKALRFLTREDGPAAVEYAVMLALILAAIFATIQAVGLQVGNTFDSARDEISGAINN